VPFGGHPGQGDAGQSQHRPSPNGEPLIAKRTTLQNIRWRIVDQAELPKADAPTLVEAGGDKVFPFRGLCSTDAPSVVVQSSSVFSSRRIIFPVLVLGRSATN